MEVDSALKPKLPKIVDHSGNEIVAKNETDNTVLGVEKFSGVVIQARQRLQINFVLNGKESNPNGIFNQFDTDLIMPFVFVKRDSVMTDDQVRAILGDLISAASVKIPLLCVFIILGVLLATLSCCCLKKLRTDEVDRASFSSNERKNLIDEINGSSRGKK